MRARRMTSVFNSLTLSRLIFLIAFIILLGGLLNLVLALSLAPRFGALGMAWGVVSVEFWVTAAILVYLIRRRLFPTGGGPL